MKRLRLLDSESGECVEQLRDCLARNLESVSSNLDCLTRNLESGPD